MNTTIRMAIAAMALGLLVIGADGADAASRQPQTGTTSARNESWIPKGLSDLHAQHGVIGATLVGHQASIVDALGMHLQIGTPNVRDRVGGAMRGGLLGGAQVMGGRYP